MIQIETVLQSVVKAYNRGEITKEEGMRVLYKHGFTTYANDERAFEFYLNHAY